MVAKCNEKGQNCVRLSLLSSLRTKSGFLKWMKMSMDSAKARLNSLFYSELPLLVYLMVETFLAKASASSKGFFFTR